VKSGDEDQYLGAKRFAVKVIHPKSGAEAQIVIHAPSIEDANKMVHTAGLLASSIAAIEEEPPETSPPHADEAARRWEIRARQLHRSQLSVENLISWSFGFLGLFITIYGIVQAILGNDFGALTAIGIGLFLQAIVAIYKWYWRDQGPWR
jgi:hypothetical protein